MNSEQLKIIKSALTNGGEWQVLDALAILDSMELVEPIGCVCIDKQSDIIFWDTAGNEPWEIENSINEKIVSLYLAPPNYAELQAKYDAVVKMYNEQYLYIQALKKSFYFRDIVRAK